MRKILYTLIKLSRTLEIPRKTGRSAQRCCEVPRQDALAPDIQTRPWVNHSLLRRVKG